MTAVASAAGIRLLIVDDEELARKRLRQLLEPYGERFALSEAANGLEALAQIEARTPQLVLLDVEMPKMNGFQLLQQLERVTFQVIFQTAYDEFALKAFEVNACDYLLKPVTPEGLKRALDRALARLAGAAAPDKAVAALLRQAPPLSRFLVKAGSRQRFVEEEQVEYFSSKEHVTYIHLADIHFAIDLSLTHLEESLDRGKFLRLHRNCIVNMARVAGFTTGAEMTVTLKSGETFKVARDRHKPVRDALTAAAAAPR